MRKVHRITAPLIAGLLFAALSALAAPAQETANTTIAMVSDIEQSILAGDQASALLDKLSSYRAAQLKFSYLESFSDNSQSDEALAAKRAIDGLADNGVTGDILATDVLSTIIELIAEGKSDPQIVTQYKIDVETQLARLQSPELRASSYVKLADLDAAHDAGSALAYLGKALDQAVLIEETESKNSLLNAVAQTAVQLKSESALTLVDEAIGSMWPSKARADARYFTAKAQLSDTAFAGTKEADLGDAVVTALGNADLALAINLAMAIQPDDVAERSKALDAVLDAAIDKSEVSVFVDLATAYADDSEQQDVIVKIVESRIDDDRIVDAVNLAATLPEGPVRARVEFLLATALQNAGYDTMAEEAFARGKTIVSALSGPQKDAALAEAIIGSSALERLDEGMAFYQQLGSVSQASRALRKLSKALSDAGRIEDAELIYDKLTDADDRDYALSGIAQARAKKGDVGFAVSALEKIVDVENRARVQAEIVNQYGKQSNYDQAFQLVEQIADAGYRVRALTRIVDLALDDRMNDVAIRANAIALATATAENDEDQRDKLLVEVIQSLTKAGDIEGAQTAAGTIKDPKSKARVLGILAQQAALDGHFSEALSLLDRLPANPEHDEFAADALVQIASNASDLEEAVARVRAFSDDMLRVRTFRLIAQAQLKRLDTLGLGMGTGTSADYAHTPSNSVGAQIIDTSLPANSTVFSSNGLVMHQSEGQPENLAKYGFPNLDYGVADIRRALPAVKAGYVGVTLARLSPYYDYFLQDLAGGGNTLTNASLSQGLLSPKVIVIESGVYTLGMLEQTLAASGDYQLVTRDHDTVTLRAPLLVGAGATLILSGQEAAHYRLSADSGAFISVAGRLFIVDTNVSSWDNKTQSPRHSDKTKRDIFRPFIVGWSGSEMSVGGSVLDSLGYAAHKSFGLTFSTGPTSILKKSDDLPAPTGHVVDNLFQNFEFGFYSFEAQDIVLAGNEYRDNVVYGIDPHDRSRRLLIALNTIHSSQYKHGIIISREVDDGWMVGNISFENAGSGLMLDRNSTNTLIYGNVAFNNNQDGLTFFESSCNLVTSNHFFGNKRAGIKVRNSWDVGIFHNQILDNGEAGIDGYTSRIEETSESRNFVEDPYFAVTTFAAGDNAIAGNAAGIKTRGVLGFSMFQQNFKGQTTPLLTGDARAFEGHMLRFNNSGGVTTVASGACPVVRPLNYCAFRANGIMAGDGQDIAFAKPGQPPCGSQSTAGSEIAPAKVGS